MGAQPMYGNEVAEAYPRLTRYGICGAVSGGSNPEARGSENVSIVRFTATNPCAR